MRLYAIRRVSGWAGPDALGRALQRARRAADEMPEDVCWLRSYVVAEQDGTLGTLCVFRAASAEMVREHAERAALPATGVCEIVETLVVRQDPQ